jgi:beta-lactamase superfamily II metal-dependent hydrolase
MVKKAIADDLVKVFNNNDRKELLTILAWGDSVEIEEDESDSEFYKIKTDKKYRDVGNSNYEKTSVYGLIKKKVILKEEGEIKVIKTSFVDVQQGDGIFIESPLGRKILIDGGDNALFARYLAQKHRNSSKDNPLIIDAIVVTHGDADHFAGLTEIWKSEDNRIDRKRLFLRPLRIFHNGIIKGPSRKGGKPISNTQILGKTKMHNEKLYLSELVDDLRQVKRERLNKPFASWTQAIKAWEKNGKETKKNPVTITRLQFGDDDKFSFLHDEDINIKVLAPFTEQISGVPSLPMLGPPPKQISLEATEEVANSTKTYSASHTINGHSIVLQMQYGNVRFLFTGDLNQDSSLELQRWAKEDGLHLQSEIFKVPHHGSADFSHTFIETVKPVISIISSGDENARKEYIHPRATIVGSLGRYSRVPRPLIFVTEMVAFFEYMGKSKLLDTKKKTNKSSRHAGGQQEYYGFKRSSFGIVHVRTDGRRVLVFTHTGKRDLKEAYAFEVSDNGEITNFAEVKPR